jgi:hypothetical protein
VTAPITDEELARLEDGWEDMSASDWSYLEVQDAQRIIARMRAAEARAKKAEEERDEAERRSDASQEAVDIVVRREDDKLHEAHARGRADERTDVVRWCRTTLSQNRNAQAFADDIERGAHVKETP